MCSDFPACVCVCVCGGGGGRGSICPYLGGWGCTPKPSSSDSNSDHNYKQVMGRRTGHHHKFLLKMADYSRFPNQGEDPLGMWNSFVAEEGSLTRYCKGPFVILPEGIGKAEGVKIF